MSRVAAGRLVAVVVTVLGVCGVARVSEAQTPAGIGLEHHVVATSKTSTMEKELNDAAEKGFRFARRHGRRDGVRRQRSRRRHVEASGHEGRASSLPPARDEQDIDDAEGTAGRIERGISSTAVRRSSPRRSAATRSSASSSGTGPRPGIRSTTVWSRRRRPGRSRRSCSRQAPPATRSSA